MNDSKVIPFFLGQQCDFYLFRYMQGTVLLMNRTRRYHGVQLLVSRFNYIEILLFERLAFRVFFPSLERNYVHDFVYYLQYVRKRILYSISFDLYNTYTYMYM